MIDPKIKDRALGAYLGLACGDALGATVEFMTKSEIAREMVFTVTSRAAAGCGSPLER
jgi:ADP-ribosylglycohydrolase